MGMTIDVPDGFEGLGESLRALLSDIALGGKTARFGRTPDYGKVEENVAERAAEIERQSHRVMLQALDVDARSVTIDGKQHRRVLRDDATYHTMAGDVVVTRSLYRECGMHREKTVDAVSLRAGVVGDGWLPLTTQADGAFPVAGHVAGGRSHGATDAQARLLAVELRARRPSGGRAVRRGRRRRPCGSSGTPHSMSSRRCPPPRSTTTAAPTATGECLARSSFDIFYQTESSANHVSPGVLPSVRSHGYSKVLASSLSGSRENRS